MCKGHGVFEVSPFAIYFVYCVSSGMMSLVQVYVYVFLGLPMVYIQRPGLIGAEGSKDAFHLPTLYNLAHDWRVVIFFIVAPAPSCGSGFAAASRESWNFSKFQAG